MSNRRPTITRHSAPAENVSLSLVKEFIGLDDGVESGNGGQGSGGGVVEFPEDVARLSDIAEAIAPLATREDLAEAMADITASIPDMSDLVTQADIEAVEAKMSGLQAEATAKWVTLNNLENSVNSLAQGAANHGARVDALELSVGNISTVLAAFLRS